MLWRKKTWQGQGGGCTSGEGGLLCRRQGRSPSPQQFTAVLKNSKDTMKSKWRERGVADYSGVRGVISIWSPLKDRALVWKTGSHSHQCPNPDPALTFCFRVNGLSSQRSRATVHSTSGSGKDGESRSQAYRGVQPQLPDATEHLPSVSQDNSCGEKSFTRLPKLYLNDHGLPHCPCVESTFEINTVSTVFP